MFVCSVENTNDCSNNFTITQTMCESTKNFKRGKHQRVQQKCGLKEPDGRLFTASEFAQSVCSKPLDLKLTICSMHVHTEGRLLVFRPHQRDFFFFLDDRILPRHYLADSKLHLGLLPNTLERYHLATESRQYFVYNLSW